MASVKIEEKSYEMPPKDGMSIAHFLTVKDIERSARYYEKVFGARILSLGDGNAPGYLQLANIWMIVNVGGGPTVDKPSWNYAASGNPGQPKAAAAVGGVDQTFRVAVPGRLDLIAGNVRHAPRCACLLITDPKVPHAAVQMAIGHPATVRR